MHSISIVDHRWRDAMAKRMGEVAWKGLHGLVSLLGLMLIVWGYGLARQEPVVLYLPPAWLRHIALLLLLFVFPLLIAAYFPGRISRRVKNPMLIAVKTWALAHLLMNGMLADVLLFGAFLAWAVADLISLKRRPPRPLPVTAPTSPWNDAIAVAAGLAVYGAFVGGLHRWLIGVPVVG
jgi:uncharacterized membrane protein